MLPYRYTSEESLTDAADCAEAPRRRNTTSLPIAPAVEGFERGARAALRRPAARHHRGEHPVARARHGADGGLQQARPDAGDDRQQVGGVGRLFHDLRRHERRLQSDQGPLQDRGLPAGALPEPRAAAGLPRAGGRGHPASTSSTSRRRRSCARTRRTRIRCRPTTCSTPSSNAWWRRRCGCSEIVALGHDRATVKRVEQLLYLAEYKRRQAAPGVKITHAEFRPRPPLSDHQPLPRQFG